MGRLPLDLQERLSVVVEDELRLLGRSSRAHMVRLHLFKPWIRDYLGPLIAPAKPGLGEYLGEEIGKWEGSRWHYPSVVWWEAHADTSHPPKGNGCNPRAHAEFLSGQEFHYLAVRTDGTVSVLGPDDFDTECAWWQRNVRTL